MHGLINVKSSNISKWQVGFNSAFKGLMHKTCGIFPNENCWGFLRAKEQNPLKFPTDTEAGIPITHQLMDSTNKEIPALLQDLLQLCDLHVFIYPFLRRLNTWKWFGQRSGCLGDHATPTSAQSTDYPQHCAPQGQTSCNTVYPLWAWWNTLDSNVKGLQTPNHQSNVDSGWRKGVDAAIVQWFQQQPSEFFTREDTSGDVSMECLYQCPWIPVLITFTQKRMQMVYI
jgi:hypothetical protein